MKISKRSVKKKGAAKWMLYAVSIYLLASWGVNQVINPLIYVKSAIMYKKPLNISDRDGDILIAFEEEDSQEDGQENSQNSQIEENFLSFCIVESDKYSFDLRITGYSEDEAAQERIIHVFKGWNTLDLRKLKKDQWKKIAVPKQTVEQNGLLLEHAELSEYPNVDLFRMLSVYLSFFALVIFWEGIRWIKRKYAQ